MRIRSRNLLTAGRPRRSFRNTMWLVLGCCLAHGDALATLETTARLAAPTEVNAYTTGSQGRPAVCVAADKSFTVVWQDGGLVSDHGRDGEHGSIWGQRYDEDGFAIATEFQVNTQTVGDQHHPKVGCAPDGDFLVVWQTDDATADGDGTAIAARAFDATGAPKGPQTIVNAYTTGAQSTPDVCGAPTGDFAVVWKSTLPADGVFARLVDENGTPQGGDVQMDATPLASAHAPAVACDGTGGFVAAWRSTQNANDVLARRFDAAATPLGTEFQVNSYTTGSQGTTLDVSVAPDGRFVVGWIDSAQFPSWGAEAMARPFAADATPAATEIRVGSGDPGYLVDTDVTVGMGSDGKFMVGWILQIPNRVNIRGYAADGTPEGEGDVVDLGSTGRFEDQIAPGPNGRFIIAWSSHDATTSSRDVFYGAHATWMCETTPRTGCRTNAPGKSKMLMKDHADPAKRQISWKWAKGDLTPIGALGNPATGLTRYELCMYDASADPQPFLRSILPPSRAIAALPLWKASGTKGFKYKDNVAGGSFADTVVAAKVKAGDAGKAMISAKSVGGGIAQLQLPGMPVSTPLLVQFVADGDAGIECWEAEFTTWTKNEADLFSAKGP